ncbi:MAG: NfeD family protein [Burkholderiaceae bacterium]|nr:NfeD family protein [Microbacteriaceae bacterium]
MVDLTNYLWIAWLVIVFVCVIIELLSLEFTFLMLAVGSLGGLGAELLGWPWWAQIIVAALLSVLLVLTIRPILLRTLRKDGDPTPSNIAALIGLGGRVLAPIGENGGLVKLANGETWTARLAAGMPSLVIALGEQVTVVAIDGSTAVIAPSERNIV